MIDKEMINIEITNEDKSTENSTESGIAFDPDVVNSVGDSASSLEDIYGYPVFTDNFANKIAYIQNKENKEMDNAFMIVFEEEIQSEIDDAFNRVMAADMDTVITINYNNSFKEKDSVLSFVGFTTIGMILTIPVFILVDKLRKKGKKDRL